MWALRKSGVNTKQMARSSGTASIMYGCDTQGVADGMLKDQRSVIARAAAPEGKGKNPLKTLYALDGSSGTLDPAFEAHALLVKHWTLAWWENWVDPDALTASYELAKSKHGSGKVSWNSVAGPAAALHLSMRRANWQWTHAHSAIDDLGNVWDFRLDPPVATAAAMRNSIRRLRFAQIAADTPQLVPERGDTASGRSAHGFLTIDFAHILQPLIDGRTRVVETVKEWLPKHAPMLLSALSGGQWTQTRRAKVPKWGITDSRCQLCFDGVGNVEHRLHCRHTTPEDGWSEVPKEARLAADRISGSRKKILKTAGLLALKVPAPPPRKWDSFNWLSGEPDTMRTDLRWFIDGSFINGRWAQLATAGFGIVVVADDGELVAWGWGIPPRWCNSASAAEAWALHTVVQMCPFAPRVVTDCLGLVHTAQRGLHAAAAPSMQLARIWRQIASCLDGSLAQLTAGENLVWMPAHQGIGRVGHAEKSNGKLLTAIEWRSNRLVDHMAKLAAADGQTPEHVTKLVLAAEVLVRHCAAQLGVATWAANNHWISVVAPDGTVTKARRRDAQEAPKGTVKKAPVVKKLAKTAEAQDDTAEISSWNSSDEEKTYGAPKVSKGTFLTRRGIADRKHDGMLRTAAAEMAQRSALLVDQASTESRLMNRKLNRQQVEAASNRLCIAARAEPTPSLGAASKTSSASGPAFDYTSAPKLDSRLASDTSTRLRSRPARGSSHCSAKTSKDSIAKLLGG